MLLDIRFFGANSTKMIEHSRRRGKVSIFDVLYAAVVCCGAPVVVCF